MAPNTTAGALDKAKKLVAMAASMATTAVVVRTVLNDYLPCELQSYVRSAISRFLTSEPAELTVVIKEYEGFFSNHVYEAVQAYLGGMVSASTKRLRVRKEESKSNMVVLVDEGEEVVVVFEGVEFRWKHTTQEGKKSHEDEDPPEISVFEVRFHRNYKDVALQRYLPFVVKWYEAIKVADAGINLHMIRHGRWESVTLDHPATFESVALDPEMKRMVVGDLEKFVKRKDYYRKVGKAWKRGYLLYGPPGTGKSSLIAAMANFLKFDIYDLELTEVDDNNNLRSLLIATNNRSIIVVEDIDCTIELKNRKDEEQRQAPPTEDGSGRQKVTLSGLLNAIDGLWSCCGDERIVVFTTNHKEKLDPALLRPGRMDMHIHMSYCTFSVFKVLADNYHSIKDHPMFPEIQRLMAEREVTPAEVAGELMKSDDVDVALGHVVKLLEEKEKTERERVDLVDDGDKPISRDDGR